MPLTPLSTAVRRASLLLVVLVLPVASACTLLLGAAAGAGASVVYLRGEHGGYLEAPAADVLDAAERALADMALAVERSTRTPQGGELEARGAGEDDARVTVVVEQEAEGLTRLSIRVGLLGDEALSGRIWRATVERLPSRG